MEGIRGCGEGGKDNHHGKYKLRWCSTCTCKYIVLDVDVFLKDLKYTG